MRPNLRRTADLAGEGHGLLGPRPATATRAPISLESWMHERHVFTTRLPGDPRSAVRTHGSIVSSTRPLVAFGQDEIVGQVEPTAPEGCARDKVALLASGSPSRVSCHQVSACRTAVEIVACQNATAAAAVVQNLGLGRASYTFELDLPGHAGACASGETELDPDEGAVRVFQTWSRVPLVAKAVEPGPGERRRAICDGALNVYLLVELGDGQDLARFDVEEADRRWRLQFPGGSRPQARVAVFTRAGGEARVRFFTCGDREHPSAPPTGLAVLHVALEQLGWEPIDRVVTGAGPARSPATRVEAGGRAEIVFAPLLVRLEPA